MLGVYIGTVYYIDPLISTIIVNVRGLLGQISRYQADIATIIIQYSPAGPDGAPMVPLWYPYGTPMVPRWYPDGTPMVPRWCLWWCPIPSLIVIPHYQ